MPGTTPKHDYPAFPLIIVFVLLSIMGAALLPLQNISLAPSRSLPSITVSFGWHNASPRVMEYRVTSKLEGTLNRMEGVKEIESRSSKSAGRITIRFRKDRDMEAARFEAAALIRRVYSQLPAEVSFPRIAVNKPGDEETYLLSYALHGPATPLHLQQYAQNHFKPALAQIPGTYQVQVYGAMPYHWQITFNPEKMQQLQINTATLQQAVENWFSRQSLGYALLDTGKRSTQTEIRVQTARRDSAYWDKIPIARRSGRLIYLRDIASVHFVEKQPDSYSRINGQSSVNMEISREKQVNSLQVAREVKKTMAHLKTQLPPGYHIRKLYDATDYINRELQKVGIRAAIALVVLLLFVWLISRKLRYLLMIALSLLANLLIAAIFYYLLNLEIHIYSLAGITISLGIIIDNSIMMIDHLRHQGNKRVFLAILGATLTTAGSLSLVFFLSQKARINLYDFSLVIIVNLLVSLFIALFFIPSLMQKLPLHAGNSRRFIRRKRRVNRLLRIYERFLALGIRHKWVFILLLIWSFGLPLYLLPQQLEGDTRAHNIYNATLGSKTYNQHIRLVLDKWSGGALRLFTEFVYEGSFYRQPERTRLYVLGEMPEGSTIQQLNQAVQQMEAYISTFDEISLFKTHISSYKDARISIFFTEEAVLSGFPFLLKGRLIQKAHSLGGMSWSVFGVGRGFSNKIFSGRKNAAIFLLGYNYRKLTALAEELIAHISQNKRVQEPVISTQTSMFRPEPLQQEYVLALKREQLTLRGVSPYNVHSQLRYYTLQPRYMGHYRISGRLNEVVMKARHASQRDLWYLRAAPLPLDSTVVKLGQDAAVSRKPSANAIYKKNQEYLVAVKFDYLGPPGLRKTFVQEQIQSFESMLPVGYKAREPYFWYQRQEDENRQWLLPLVIGIIFFICAILFESLRQPLAVLSLIPVSFIGIFLTFYIFDINFDQGGFAAFVLIAGVTVNAALYIINDYNNLKRQSGRTHLRMYAKAWQQKSIPVFLTITSTILGLVPFLIGGQNEVFWFAFAAGSIGGLLFSIPGILLFLPLFFVRKKVKQRG